MMKKWITVAMVLAAGLALAKMEAHWDGGRNVPIHRLALMDELGDAIMPATPGALPVSTRQTCNQCHDYAAIASGWHFNMCCTNTPAGRPSEPWFLVDALSGSQIPMGLRNGPGLYKPGQLGMSNWEFVLAFGRHMPGGSIADPEDRYAEGGPKSRWEVSGPIEINCFACHSQDKEYDHSEWVRLISRQNFRWAMTGALGLGEVLGMGSRMDDYWGMLRGLNPDDSMFKVPPHMNYDLTKFDSKNRTVLELGKPRSENCLSCHSATQAGMDAKDIDGDVHLRAGMSCADCHRNGIEHTTARGFVGDNTGAMDKTRATASCTGCHNGTATAKAGRFGAPAPKHVGYPLVHFEKLNCTVCHSGVTEGGDLAQVRTSRSNRMGVYGRARWATPQPFIVEPVFVKDGNGKLTPSRMAWPAYWGEAKGDAVTPINPERVNELCKGLFDVREQVGTILVTLAANPNIPGKPAWVMDKMVYQANVDGVIVPVKKTEVEDGFYYQIPEGQFPSLPFYDPDADTSALTDGLKADREAVRKFVESLVSPDGLFTVLPFFNPIADADVMPSQQAAVFKGQKRLLDDMFKTLDAAEKAIQGDMRGAIVFGDRAFYKTNTVQKVKNEDGEDTDEDEEKEVMVFKTVSKPEGKVSLGWVTEANREFSEFWDEYTAHNATQLAGSDYSLTEEMVAAGLKRLQEQGIANPVYVGHGQVWSLDASGALVAKDAAVAAPVSWAVGHDVRPARMARGAKPVKCADCHTTDSKFFFAKVESTGPLMTAKKLVKAQNEFMGASGSYNRLFGATFLMRPMFKIFLWVVFAFVGLVAVAFTAAAIPSMLMCSESYETYGKRNAKLIQTADTLAALGMAAATAYLAFSGIMGWFFHWMTGYILIFHMVAGGLFAVCLFALIWLRGEKRIKNPKRSVLWMIMLVLGVCVLFTAVAPMMTWLGEGWQLTLLKGHRCSTMCFIAVSVWMLITGGRKE